MASLTSNPNSYNICSECSGLLVQSRGDMVCMNCGVVDSEKKIIINLEKRAYTNEEFNARKRTGNLVTDKDLMVFSTVINKSDIKGKSFPKRLLKINTFRKTSFENGYHLLSLLLNNFCSALGGVPYRLKLEAKKILKQVKKTNFNRGRSIEHSVIASIYIAGRITEYPIILKDFNMFNIKTDGVKKTINLLQKKFKIVGIKPPNLGRLAIRFCNDLGLNDIDFQKKVVELIKINYRFITGHKPATIISGIIYYVCKANKIKITQEKIAKICGITEVSLRVFPEKLKDLNLNPIIENNKSKPKIIVRKYSHIYHPPTDLMDLLFMVKRFKDQGLKQKEIGTKFKLPEEKINYYFELLSKLSPNFRFK